jgi:hypothetical protein
MTVMLNTAGAMVGFAIGTIVASAAGLTPPWTYLVAAVVGVVAFTAWIYSPLPDHTGGMMMGEPDTSWGWSSDDE